MCLFSASITENKASFNGLLLFIGSVVIDVALSKSKLYLLWVVHVYSSDASSCRRMAA